MLNNPAGKSLASSFTRANPFLSAEAENDDRGEEGIVRIARREGLREGGYETRFGPRLGGVGVGAVVGVRWRGDAREVGDHVVLWGEVEEVLAAGPGEGGAEALCYLGGKYGGVKCDEEEEVREEIVD